MTPTTLPLDQSEATHRGQSGFVSAIVTRFDPSVCQPEQVAEMMFRSLRDVMTPEELSFLIVRMREERA